MAKHTIEAQRRIDIKRASARQDREGTANLAAASVATKTSSLFVDFDFALGLLAEAASWSSAKRAKVAESGRALHLVLLPDGSTDEAGVDLVARIPADRAELPLMAKRLVGLGLRSNRRRVADGLVEFAGRGDEAVVRAVVEANGGCVTVIASPPGTSARNEDTNDSLPPACSDTRTVVDETKDGIGADTPVYPDESAASPPERSDVAVGAEEEPKPRDPVPSFTPPKPGSSWPDRRPGHAPVSPPFPRPAPTVRSPDRDVFGLGLGTLDRRPISTETVDQREKSVD